MKASAASASQGLVKKQAPAKSGAAKPQAARPSAGKAKPADPTALPGSAKAGAAKPSPVKPSSAKPSSAKPASVKPGAAKPASKPAPARAETEAVQPPAKPHVARAPAAKPPAAQLPAANSAAADAPVSQHAAPPAAKASSVKAKPMKTEHDPIANDVAANPAAAPSAPAAPAAGAAAPEAAPAPAGPSASVGTNEFKPVKASPPRGFSEAGGSGPGGDQEDDEEEDRPIPPRALAKVETFAEGDHVVYPTHGVGKVEKIAVEEIAGHKLELIHITFEENRMTLRVPVAKARTAGLRKLATRKLFDEALAVLKGRARIKRTMWSRRAQEYEAKINSGDPLSIAEVVRDLHRNAGQPDQSFSERQIYESALDRLAAELGALDNTDKMTAVTKLGQFLKTVAPAKAAEPIVEEG
jgi:CarD family transcriptional regulator